MGSLRLTPPPKEKPEVKVPSFRFSFGGAVRLHAGYESSRVLSSHLSSHKSYQLLYVFLVEVGTFLDGYQSQVTTCNFDQKIPSSKSNALISKSNSYTLWFSIPFAHRLVVLVNPPSKKIKSKKFKKCLTHWFRVMYTSDECVNPLCNILNYSRNAHCSIDIAKGNLFAKCLTQVARRRTEWVHVGNQEKFFSQITQID